MLPSTAPAEAQLVLDRIHAAHPMSWSVGVAAWSPEVEVDVLFAAADRELYRAKFDRAAPVPSQPIG